MAIRPMVLIDEELCNGCGECVPSCAEGAIQIIDGKAKLVADNLCDGLGACLGDCPEGAISVVEREADDFDEKAVEDLLGRAEAALGGAGRMVEDSRRPRRDVPAGRHVDEPDVCLLLVGPDDDPDFLRDL